MMANCNVCSDKGDEFSVPWDHVGIALMQAHFADKHPEITLPAGKD